MPFTDKLMSAFGWERKSAPDLGQSYAPSFDAFRSTWNLRRIPNYKQEVGDLDGHSLVMAVVNYTGTRLPEAQPTVVKQGKDGPQSDPLHPLAALIRRPNLHYVWPNYCLALSLSWWIDGNVYFYKDRDVGSVVKQLWYLPHYLVEPRWVGDGRSPEVPQPAKGEEQQAKFLSHYQYNVPGKPPVLYPAKDVVHIKRGCDPLRRGGVSAFEPLITELYGDGKMAAFTAAIMSNMGLQVPIIRPKDKDITIKAEDAAHMKESWMAKTTGNRAGEPVVFTEPVDVEKFGFSPTELDLSQLRLIPESRVAAVTGIPAATLQLLVGLQNGTSYASSEQARQQGYEEVIIPIQQSIAEELNWQLLPEFEKDGTAEFVFDTTGVRVLQEDKDALLKRESEVLRAGGCTLDQFLSAIGRDPIGPPLGDVRYVPSINTPMTPERLIATAEGTLAPPVVDPAIQEAAKMVDVDRMIANLEEQMKEFDANAA